MSKYRLPGIILFSAFLLGGIFLFVGIRGDKALLRAPERSDGGQARPPADSNVIPTRPNFAEQNLGGEESPASSCIPRLDFPRTGKTVCVEIADDFSERVQGLADRDNLDEGSGMLFVFDSESSALSFHMAGMRFPLDMFFLREVGPPVGGPTSARRPLEVVYIAQNLPPCFTLSGVEGPDRQNCASVQPNVPAQYVLEINAGKAAEWGIGVGDTASLSF